jgi:hypothetical protein
MSFTVTYPTGVPAGSVFADPAGLPVDPELSNTFTRSFTMFQALYADLARAHRRRRQREFQRQVEARAQHELLLHLPRLLAR